MNNSQYISSLKKALAGLDKASLNDIIAEIESHAAESGSALIDQFGAPEQLAKQYLDGEKIAQPITTKVMGVSKSILQVLGIAAISLIALLAIATYFFTKDKFNYADENAPQLSERKWKSQPWSSNLTLNTDQASVIIYWHGENTVRWDCDGSDPEKENDSTLLIRQSHCYVYLPKVPTAINAEQSQLVLVKPQISLSVNARQASVKVAENGEKYKYDYDTKHTHIADLNSIEDAQFVLQFKAKESTISSYQY